MRLPAATSRVRDGVVKTRCHRVLVGVQNSLVLLAQDAEVIRMRQLMQEARWLVLLRPRDPVAQIANLALARFLGVRAMPQQPGASWMEPGGCFCTLLPLDPDAPLAQPRQHRRRNCRADLVDLR